MNKYYHVDKTGRLKTGMEINLSPDKYSVFGNAFVNKNAFGRLSFDCDRPSPEAILLNEIDRREYYLEYTRKKCPLLRNMPSASVSRLSSFFSLVSIEDARRMIVENSGFGYKPAVYEVETSEPVIKLDMSWLDFEFHIKYEKVAYYYINYWKGNKIDNDQKINKKKNTLIEVLITSPIIVGNRVNYE